jgi:hypothetical protein
MEAVNEKTAARNLVSSLYRGPNIMPIAETEKSTINNVINIRHAVRHGEPLRRNMTNKQASIRPRFIAAKLYHGQRGGWWPIQAVLWLEWGNSGA